MDIDILIIVGIIIMEQDTISDISEGNNKVAFNTRTVQTPKQLYRLGCGAALPITLYIYLYHKNYTVKTIWEKIVK